jgi:hypothetical protein
VAADILNKEMSRADQRPTGGISLSRSRAYRYSHDVHLSLSLTAWWRRKTERTDSAVASLLAPNDRGYRLYFLPSPRVSRLTGEAKFTKIHEQFMNYIGPADLYCVTRRTFPRQAFTTGESREGELRTSIFLFK